MTIIKRDYYSQDPDDKLDYDFDFTDFVGATDSIIVNTITVKPSGELTVDGVTMTTTKVKIWVSSGVVGKSYAVETQVTTALGRKKTLYLIIQIRQP